jgi:hypothetical protein
VQQLVEHYVDHDVWFRQKVTGSLEIGATEKMSQPDPCVISKAPGVGRSANAGALKHVPHVARTFVFAASRLVSTLGWHLPHATTP